jgi:hypothetical protein
MPRLFHLTLGDNAAACLRASCQSRGVPDTVIAIPDDLSHGPLDDGRARIDYMRACFRGYGDWRCDLTDAFAPWSAMVQRLMSDGTVDVLIWSGSNVSESVFLAMTCWWLRGRRERVLRVTPAKREGRDHVSNLTPAEIVGQYESRQVMTDKERASLADDFLRIRDQTNHLRRWEGGLIAGIPIDSYDPLLAESCPPSWTPAARVVGAAMKRCGPRNPMSDLFFSSRLQVLIETGRVEADGPRRRLREYRVRSVAA